MNDIRSQSGTVPDQDRRRGPYLIVLACVLATSIVIAVNYLLDTRFLTDSPASVIYATHAATSFAVLGLIVGFTTLSTGRSLFGGRANAGTAQASAGRPGSEAEWFIGLRWLAVGAVAASLVLTIPIAGLLPPNVLVPLVLLVITLSAGNLLFSSLLSRFGDSDWFLLAQAFADLAVLTALLYNACGMENPLSVIYVFHVLIGGILLPRRQAYILASVALTLFTLLGSLRLLGCGPICSLVLTLDGGPAHFHPTATLGNVAGQVLVMGLLLFCSTYLTTRVAGRLRRTERSLLKAADVARGEKLRLESVLDASGAGLIVVDAQSHVEFLNAKAADWMRSLAQIPSDAEAIASLAPRCLESGQLEMKELEIERDGQRKYLLISATPVPAPDGRPAQVVELFQDITARRVAEITANQAAKLAAIGELAGTVAHEINNPVGVISAKARLLLRARAEEPLTDKVRRGLNLIVGHADRIADITKGLLSFAHPTSGTRKAINVNDAITRALRLIEPVLRDGRIQTDFRLAPDLPPVPGNLNELQQVIVNLASNALDAMEHMEHGGRLSIHSCVESGPEGDQVVIHVSDTGTGIDSSIRDHIFEPFQTTKPEGRGTGLGLSISLGLVRSHTGCLEVQDLPAGGTRFSVRLPVSSKEVNS